MKISLTTREKGVLIAGLIILGSLLGNQFVAKPMRERLSTLNRVVGSKEKILGQLRQMSAELSTLRSEVTRLRRRIEAQPDKGRMLSLLERIQEKVGLSGHVVHMRPTAAALGKIYEETTIEVKLDAVTLEQLLGFLGHLDALELAIGIKSLEVRKVDSSSGSSLLGATVRISTISPSA